MIRERGWFGDRRGLEHSLLELLFEPGAQLMHVDASPWTEVEAHAVVGLRVLRAYYSASNWAEYDSNWLVRMIFDDDEAFLDSARRLIALLGYEERTLVPIARLFAHVRRRFTLSDSPWPQWQCEGPALAVYFRLLHQVGKDFGGFLFRLADFLNRHAAQLRGSDYGKLRLADMLSGRYATPKTKRQPVCFDWNAGNCFQAVFLQLPDAVVEDWAARPEVRSFAIDGTARLEPPRWGREGHLAVLLDPAAERLQDPENHVAVGAQVDWALLHRRVLICQSEQRFEELLAQTVHEQTRVLLQHRRLSSYNAPRLALRFFESTCRHGFGDSCAVRTPVGMPAVIAARRECVMPWLILHVNSTFWFLEASAQWDCFGIQGTDLLCKPRSEAALLEAFSRLGRNDNIAYGAISGSIDEQTLRNALSIEDVWGTDAVLQWAQWAPWAYGHQWGGGSDEHFSIFCAQDLAMSAALAESLGQGNYTWI